MTIKINPLLFHPNPAARGQVWNAFYYGHTITICRAAPRLHLHNEFAIWCDGGRFTAHVFPTPMQAMSAACAAFAPPA